MLLAIASPALLWGDLGLSPENELQPFSNKALASITVRPCGLGRLSACTEQDGPPGHVEAKPVLWGVRSCPVSDGSRFSSHYLSPSHCPSWPSRRPRPPSTCTWT